MQGAGEDLENVVGWMVRGYRRTKRGLMPPRSSARGLSRPQGRMAMTLRRMGAGPGTGCPWQLQLT